MRRAAPALGLVVAGALAGAGCLRSTEFRCETHDECGRLGTCQPIGFCSFPDPDCNGQRFSESAGPYANQCVTGMTIDGGLPDAPPPDAQPSGCPIGYLDIPGAPGHRYRVLNVPEPWAVQRDICAAASSTTYLAIPDSAAELSALGAFAAMTPYWLGLTDAVSEGDFVTTKGEPATFLPWAPGQPSNNMNSDCVTAISTTQIDDRPCAEAHRAICECEPDEP